jgi:hypothetical protein
MILSHEYYNYYAAQSGDGRITYRQVSIWFTHRSLACSGEAVTVVCTSNGTGISWDSDPPLGQNGESRINVFVRSDGAGSHRSYLRNCESETAFFVSTVLQGVDDDDCNSSLTLVPIPNAEGNYPTFYNPRFNIFCSTTNTTVTNPEMEWTYRVAGNSLLYMELILYQKYSLSIQFLLAPPPHVTISVQFSSAVIFLVHPSVF